MKDLERIAAGLTLLIACGILVSTLYWHAYSQTLGINVFPFLTLNDLWMTSLSYLVPSLFSIFVFASIWIQKNLWEGKTKYLVVIGSASYLIILNILFKYSNPFEALKASIPTLLIAFYLFIPEELFENTFAKLFSCTLVLVVCISITALIGGYDAANSEKTLGSLAKHQIQSIVTEHETIYGGIEKIGNGYLVISPTAITFLSAEKVIKANILNKPLPASKSIGAFAWLKKISFVIYRYTIQFLSQAFLYFPAYPRAYFI